MSIEEPRFRPGSRPQSFDPSRLSHRAGAEETATREYIGWINLGDGKRIPLSVFAGDVDEAYERVVKQYGEGHELSIWNEEDAHTYRVQAVGVTDAAMREQIASFAHDGIVRHLDAARMTELPGLFAEFAEKLEFPSYFGHNSYALVDCLDDLHGSWHGGRAVAVVVGAADPFVGTDFFPMLVSLLCEAAERARARLQAASWYLGSMTLGWHSCDFCPAHARFKGNGEHRYYTPGGQVYCAPMMLLHYVDEHGYRPPAEFLADIVPEGVLTWDWRAERLAEAALNESEEPVLRVEAVVDLPNWREPRSLDVLRQVARDEFLADIAGGDIGLAIGHFLPYEFAGDLLAEQFPSWVRSGIQHAHEVGPREAAT